MNTAAASCSARCVSELFFTCFRNRRKRRLKSCGGTATSRTRASLRAPANRARKCGEWLTEICSRAHHFAIEVSLFCRGMMLSLDAARRQTDALFRLVRPEALYERPIPERHRLIFYLGHLEAFDWNLICAGKLEMPRFHPAFDRLFAFGIAPPPGQSPA